jgi:hypothetical protein
MKSSRTGTSISKEIEVFNISSHGLWLYVNGKEYFLSYQEYPWFRDAKVKEIFDVVLLHGIHLYWPQLDVDLEIDSLDHPDQYPLRYA